MPVTRQRSDNYSKQNIECGVSSTRKAPVIYKNKLCHKSGADPTDESSEETDNGKTLKLFFFL